MNTLGERLTYLRNKANLSAAQVIKKTNVVNLGRYEKDERKPSIDSLLSIAQFYKVTTDWLLVGKEPLKNELDQDEAELIKYFNKLTTREKYILLGELKNQTKNEEAHLTNSTSLKSSHNDMKATIETA